MTQTPPVNPEDEANAAPLSQDQQARLEDFLKWYAKSQAGDDLLRLRHSIETTMRASANLIMLSDHFGSDAKLLTRHIDRFKKRVSAMEDAMIEAMSKNTELAFSPELKRKLAHLIDFLHQKYPISIAPWAEKCATDGTHEGWQNDKSWQIVNESRMVRMYRTMADLSELIVAIPSTVYKEEAFRYSGNKRRPVDMRLLTLLSWCDSAKISFTALAEAMVDSGLALDRSSSNRKRIIKAETTRLEQAWKRAQERLGK